MTKHNSTILFFCLIFLVMTIGLGLRIYNFKSNSATLYIDEMAMLVDAKSVVATGQDMHGESWLQPIFLSYGDYKQPVYIWLLSVAVALFGDEQWVVRVPSLLAGLFTIFITPLIGLELWRWRNFKRDLNIPLKEWYITHRWLAVAIAMVVAVSPWSMTFSRAGFEGHLAQLLLALSIYALLLSLRNGWWRLVSVLLMAASTYTYYSVRFVAPAVFVSISFYQLWQTRHLASRNRTTSNIFVKIFLTILFPLIGFYMLLLPQTYSPLAAASEQYRLSTDSVLNDRGDLVLTQNVYRELAGNSRFDRLIFHRDWLFVRQLATNYADFLDFNFLFLNGDENLRHGTGAHGLFLLPFLPVFVCGIYELATKHRAMGLILFIWWMVALLPAAVPNTTPHALRSLNALVPLSIIIGVGLHSFIFFIMRRFGQLGMKIVGIGWLIWLIFAVVEFAYYYQKPYQSLSRGAWAERDQFLLEQSQALNTDQTEVFFWGVNTRMYLWIAGQPDYDNFPVINSTARSDFDQDFATTRFGIYHVNEGLPRWPDLDKSIVVMRANDWTKLTLDNDIMIVNESRYIDSENEEYVIAAISRN